MSKLYDKPRMLFVELKNKERVADKCWGNHGTGYKYYDTTGTGYVAFTIEAGSCTADSGAIQMYYYDSKEDDEPERVYEGNKYYDETYRKLLESSGGSYGQPFKGESEFPDTPEQMS